MQGIVDELVALVEGASAQGRSRQSAPRRTTGGAKPKLGLADHTYHHIADGKPKGKKAAAKQSIPMGNDFADFTE